MVDIYDVAQKVATRDDSQRHAKPQDRLARPACVPVAALFGARHCVSHPHRFISAFEHAGFGWSLVAVCVTGLLAPGATLRALGGLRG